MRATGGDESSIGDQFGQIQVFPHHQPGVCGAEATFHPLANLHQVVDQFRVFGEKGVCLVQGSGGEQLIDRTRGRAELSLQIDCVLARKVQLHLLQAGDHGLLRGTSLRGHLKPIGHLHARGVITKVLSDQPLPFPRAEGKQSLQTGAGPIETLHQGRDQGFPAFHQAMHADAAGKGGQGFLQLRVAPGQRRKLREGRHALFAIEIEGLGGGFAGHGAGVRRHQGGDGVWAVDGVDQGQLLQPGKGGEQLLPLLG